MHSSTIDFLTIRLEGKEVLCRNVSTGVLSSLTSSKALVDAVAGIGTFQVITLFFRY